MNLKHLIFIFLLSSNCFFTCYGNKHEVENDYNGITYRKFVNEFEILWTKERDKLGEFYESIKEYIDKKDYKSEQITMLLIKFYEEIFHIQSEVNNLFPQKNLGKTSDDAKKYTKILQDKAQTKTMKYARLENFFKKSIKKNKHFADVLYDFTKKHNIYYINFFNFQILEDS